MFKNGFSLHPVVSITGRVGYATRVQDWTRVAYPTHPVALAIGQKPCPFFIYGSVDLIFLYHGEASKV